MNETSENASIAASKITMYGGAAGAAVGGLTISEFGIIGGLIVGLLGFIAGQYWSWRKDRREERESQERRERLRAIAAEDGEGHGR